MTKLCVKMRSKLGVEKDECTSSCGSFRHNRAVSLTPISDGNNRWRCSFRCNPRFSKNATPERRTPLICSRLPSQCISGRGGNFGRGCVPSDWHLAGDVYVWKMKCCGIGVSEPHRLRKLEEGTPSLSAWCADWGLDKVMLQDILGKKL